jgi:hypothetical protein
MLANGGTQELGAVEQRFIPAGATQNTMITTQHSLVLHLQRTSCIITEGAVFAHVYALR